jgi:glutaredoxin 3
VIATRSDLYETAPLHHIAVMIKVEIYTQPYCGYCVRAKRLLDAKGVAYEETDVAMEPLKRGEMIERAGGRSSTPQIIIDGNAIGGSDELAALNRSGELDRLLGLA